jgi:hypothetical protein
MNTTTTKARSSVGGGLGLIPFGIWILVSPFVLGYDHKTAGMLSTVIVGAVMVLIGIASEWVNTEFLALTVPFALWLFVSGFVQGLWGLNLLWSNVILAFLAITVACIGEALHLPQLENNSGQ